MVPYFLDQVFWGWRVTRLGAGPEPAPCKKLTSDRLPAAIRRVAANADMEKRARMSGEKILAEDSVARAVEAFYGHVRA